MKINSSKVKSFWDSQAAKARKMPLESVANLEENSELLNLKIDAENKKVFNRLSFLNADSEVLDLGSGAGQWAFRFSRIVKNVTAVEYSSEMQKLAVDKSNEDGIDNVKYICCGAQNYQEDKLYDLIWISGLLIYLNDEECLQLLNNCNSMLKPDGLILLRDATGMQGNYEIVDKYSEQLDANYSAVYRTREEYIKIFYDSELALDYDEDMFQQGSPLNKWQETRLRLYGFSKNAEK